MSNVKLNVEQIQEAATKIAKYSNEETAYFNDAKKMLDACGLEGDISDVINDNIATLEKGRVVIDEQNRSIANAFKTLAENKEIVDSGLKKFFETIETAKGLSKVEEVANQPKLS